MNSTFTSTSIALLIIIAGALITKKSSNYKANTFLACAYVCLACVFIYSLSDEYATIPRYLVHSDLIFFYFTYPFLYIYVAFTTGSMSGFRLKNLIHLLSVVPGVANYIFYQVHSPVNDGDFQIKLLHSQVTIIIHLMGLVILMIYLIQSFRLIYAYNQQVKSNHIQRLQISWLKTLFPLFMVPCVIQFVSVAEVNLPEEASLFKNLVLLLMLAFLILKQLHYWTLFIHTEQQKEPEHTHDLPPEELAIYEEQLNVIMVVKRAYIDPDLSVETVSKRMNITPRQLAHVIWKISNKHFPEYVYILRINYSVELLDDPESYKWKTHYFAIKCGFRTREHFSRIFKKVKGVSFGKFRRDHQNKALLKKTG